MLKSSLTMTAIVLSILSVHSQAAPKYTNQSLSTAFTLGANGNVYDGSLLLGGQTFAQGNAVNINSLSLTGGYATNSNTSTTPATTSTIYRQNYSAVIGNTAQPGSSGAVPDFVKDIVGNFTPASALPTTGTYTYNGSTVWHNVNAEGNFQYTINFATRKGSGSISDVYWTDLLGAVKLKGTLDSADIVARANGTVGVENGNVSNITTNNAFFNAMTFGSTGKTTGKYDLAIFGPNYNEVAGLVKDVAAGGYTNLQIGFAGKR